MLNLRSTWILWTLLIAAGAISACGEDAGESEMQPADGVVQTVTSHKDIDPTQLSDMMLTKDFLLINVHIPYAGEIRGTDLNIAFDQIQYRLDQLGGDNKAKIVLYCRSGHMSGTASATLASLGYTNVYNLTGGMQAWVETGHALEQGGITP